MFGVQLTLSASTSAMGVHLLVARCTVMYRAAYDASFNLLRKAVQSVGMPSCMKYSWLIYSNCYSGMSSSTLS